MQSSPKNRSRLIELDGVDTLLQLLSAYRKRDPEKDSDEEEYVENIFACLTLLVEEDAGKDKFIAGEGVELAQIMLREGKMSKPRALRVLNHALGGNAGRGACERLVEAAGLKIVFGMLMKKVRVFGEIPPPYCSMLMDSVIAGPSGCRTLARYIRIAFATSTRRISCPNSDLGQVHGEGL